MKWKRNTGFDQIEDRRGQSGGGGLDVWAAVAAVAVAASRSRSRAARPAVASADHRRRRPVPAVQRRARRRWRDPGPGRARRRRGRAGRDAEPPERRPTSSSPTSSTIQLFWARTFRRPARTTRRPSSSCSTARRSRPAGPPRPRPARSTAPPTRRSTWTSASSMSCSRASARGRRLRDGLRRRPRVRPPHPDGPRDLAAGPGAGAAGPEPAERPVGAQELQADCLAGVWAHSARATSQPGDIEEASAPPQAVGDDRIQEATTGRIDPETWTHGSAEQRVQWFTTGYRSGNSDDCDTFAA